MLPQTHPAHMATAGRSKKWVGDEGDSYEEREREEEVERPKCWLQVYPMPSTAHFALYIDMNMSG